ncbi:MAG: DUF370 domain-containing protein [Proteobacteria bacterium]|nr:DUF370 domain-containing protein [Pseudomonadota bacterium]
MPPAFAPLAGEPFPQAAACVAGRQACQTLTEPPDRRPSDGSRTNNDPYPQAGLPQRLAKRSPVSPSARRGVDIASNRAERRSPAIQLINVGYGNFISADKVIAIVDADSAPVKRAVLDARKKGSLVDATVGHKTRTVLVMSSGHLVLSAKTTETVAANFAPAAEGRKARAEGETRGRRAVSSGALEGEAP